MIYVNVDYISFKISMGSKLIKFDKWYRFIWQVDEVIQVSSTTCKYPRSPAMGLGLTAALSLLLAQVMINVSTGCVCCVRGARPPASKWRTAVICFVISWYFSIDPSFLIIVWGLMLALLLHHEIKSIWMSIEFKIGMVDNLSIMSW